MTAPSASTSVEPHAGLALDLLTRSFDGLDAGRVRIVTLPAPVGPPEHMMAFEPTGPAAVWCPSDGPKLGTIGQAARLEATGSDRFGEIRRQAEALWARVDTVSAGEIGLPPRLFGGFSFHPGSAAHEPWNGFADAAFALPRFCYGVHERAAWLSVAFTGEEARREPQALLDGARRILRGLDDAGHHERSAPRDGNGTGGSRVIAKDTMAESDWVAVVEAIRTAIAAGQVAKIVAARRALLTFSQPPNVEEVLTRLRQEAPRCTIFAFREGDATFLGATPERLVTRSGTAVETEALAGSIGSGEAAHADRLLESVKDQHEHELVVQQVVDALEPLCQKVDFAERPIVHALRHVLHLRTPISATLADEAHVLELVERLHPTPAVGGVPKRDAIRWIVEHEPLARGWYAAPVGWFDGNGDGDFDVALRSGLLAGDQAHLYAGAGIVADSDPVSEYAETGLKLKALLSVLELDP